MPGRKLRPRRVGRSSVRESIDSQNGRDGQGPGGRDVEFADTTQRTEFEYPMWWTRGRLVQDFLSLCEDSYWNSFICIIALASIVWVAIEIKYTTFKVLDIVYNVVYAVHIFGITYSLLMKMETIEITFLKSIAFLVDMATFSHYVGSGANFKLICYYLRLHRPFSYLWAMKQKNLKISVLGTTLKFYYMFLVMRVTWALVWLNIDLLQRKAEPISDAQLALDDDKFEYQFRSQTQSNKAAIKFLSALYLINKMYIPIGPTVPPANDIERLTCLSIMMSGCLVVTAFAVASLSLVISLYMRPEETFRARHRLIIKEMKDSMVAPSKRERVETFYKMYWHKHRAVSTTQLLPDFPPTLPATIFTDVYFEAIQKCKVLRDLSYQFLSELCKTMETIHYIPGDVIIERLSDKTSYFFITYGDIEVNSNRSYIKYHVIELVTAEDDSTAILRLTRGSVLTPMGVCAPAGLGKAHLQVRAATFCTAHVLRSKDLWKIVIKHGRTDEETELILESYNSHLERVKRHFSAKIQDIVKHKSSIFHFKRCLAALKEAKDANGDLLLARQDVFLEIAESYIMRNRTDATMKDESDAICLRPTFPYILQPSSSLQSVWSMFTCIIIVTVCFVHPYYLVFSKTVPAEFRFFDYLITLVFILDLFIHLSTGTNVEEGVPITLTQTTSQQMRSPWFVVDVLGTAPLFEFIGTGHFAGINKLLRVHKVFRVLQALEDACVTHSHILRFMSYTLLMLISCYLIAAMQQAFMCLQFGYCIVTNLTHSPFWVEEPLDEETIQNRVAFAMYWAISMIDFTAHMETWGTENWKNGLYTMIVLEICIMLRIYMEAVYSATILVTTSLRQNFDATIGTVTKFLIRNKVDPVLRRRFISYLQLCWYTDKAYAITNKRSIFYDLPPHVYQDIVAKQRRVYLLTLPFMKYVSPADLKTISAKAKLFYTSPNEILLNTGDISKEVYIIKRGVCEVISPDTKTVVALLKAKNHFGVLSCLLRMPSYNTIRTVTNVQVFSISRKHLLNALEVPQIKNTLEYTKKLPEFQRLLNRRESFLTYVEPDPIPNREMFPLPRKHEPDNDFLLPFYRLGFFSILRYVFPRFTIRPDGSYLIRYEWFRSTCAMASAMVFPGYSYLSIQWPWLVYVAQLLDFSAILDIFQRMLIAYYDENGILIYHPASTAAHYMKGAFFVDFLGCIPLENLESPRIESGNKNSVTTMEQFLMLNRLIQLYRVPGAMNVLRNVVVRRDILIVFKAIPIFIVILNVLTCFIVLHSVTIYRYLDSDQWLIVPFNDKGGSWVHLFSEEFRFNLTASPFNLHLGTYFWMVYEASATGYNNINPSNVNLIWLLLAGMLITGMILTYFAVKIISIRCNVNKDLAEFQEHMRDMVYFMRKESLSPQLQKVVLDYYEYTWDKMGGVDYRKMFKLCSQISLRTDAIFHIYGPTFTKCPILTHTDVCLMRIIGRSVHSAYFLRGMNIVEANDVISEMYFVDYGGVDAREVNEEQSSLNELTRGSVFGNLDGKETVCCPTTFVATSRVHLLMIKSSIFHLIISDFPAVKELMAKFRTNESYILGDVEEEGSADTSQHHHTKTSSPFVVTSRKGLIKHLYFQDEYIQIFFIAVSAVCVYIDVYNAGFQDNRLYLIIALYVLDFCFCLKILLQFTLPLIVDSAKIRSVLLPQRRNYFRGEFRYDLLSIIPIELFSLLSREHRWHIFACMRLNRMSRIVTLYKGLARHQKRITINLTLSTVMVALLWFTLFMHSISCLWYFIGTVEEWRQKKSSWIYKDDGSSWCYSKYICAMYFILTTITQNGVGDILPKKHSEVIFVIILMIASTMMYMIYVGEFSNIIQYQSFRPCSFYSKYLELEEFMKNNRVSKNLVQLVNKYSLHLWRETRGLQQPYFLKTAPCALRLEIMSAAYLHHLTRHHVFENCEPAFLRQLAGCLQLMTYNEDMYVVKSSEITDSMYLIHTGKIEEIADDSHKVPRIYPAGSYFGVIQGLNHDLPFTHSYRTLRKSQVLTLRLDDWEYLLQHYPTSQEVVQQHTNFDTKGSGGSGGSHNTHNANWKRKIIQKFTQAPKASPNQNDRRVTTVADDSESRPTDGQHVRDSIRQSRNIGLSDLPHSRAKREAERRKQDTPYMHSQTDISLPAGNASGKTTFTPEAPNQPLDEEHIQPKFQPYTEPDLNRNDTTAGLHTPNQINLDDRQIEENKVIQKHTKTEVSIISIFTPETKYQPLIDEHDVVTVDMTADQKYKTHHVESQDSDTISINLIARKEESDMKIDLHDSMKDKRSFLMQDDAPETNSVRRTSDTTFDTTRDRSKTNIEKEVREIDLEESKRITGDISRASLTLSPTKIAPHRVRSETNLGLYIQENVPSTSTVVYKEQSAPLLKLSRNNDEENELKFAQEESKMIAVNLTGDELKSSSMPTKIDLTQATSKISSDTNIHQKLKRQYSLEHYRSKKKENTEEEPAQHKSRRQIHVRYDSDDKIKSKPAEELESSDTDFQGPTSSKKFSERILRLLDKDKPGREDEKQEQEDEPGATVNSDASLTSSTKSQLSLKKKKENKNDR